MPSSLKFGRSGNSFADRTTNLPTTSAVTIMGWFLPTAVGTSDRVMIALGALGSGVDYEIYSDGAGSRLSSFNGSASAFGSVLVANVWVHIAVTVNGTSGSNFLVYLNGALNITGTAASISAGSLRFGSNGFTEPFVGSLSAIKVWNRALPADEIASEMRYSVPVDWAGLNATYPFPTAWDYANYDLDATVHRSTAATRWFDVSGNLGSDMTETGTIDYDVGPPVLFAPSIYRLTSRRFKSAVGGTTFTASLAGSITSSGALAKLAKLAKAGSVTSSGSAAKAAAVAKAGNVTPTGAATKQANKALAGSVTSSGVLSLVRAVLIALAGSVTSSGTLAKSVLKSLAGACTSSGTIAKQAAKALAGSITSSGALAKLAKLAKAGSVTASGVLSTTKVALLALAGSVTSTGTLARSALKGIVGACTSAGSLAKANAKGLTGSVTSSGALAKLIRKAYAGAVTATGTFSKVFQSGADLVIGIIGTFIVPAIRVLFTRSEPTVTASDPAPDFDAINASPAVTFRAADPALPSDDIAAPITLHEPSSEE